MSKVLFHICDGVYPSVVGGMEIFNYHLLKNLHADIAVFSSKKYDFPGLRYINYWKIRPTKIFDALQLFFVLLFNSDIQTVLFSYSEAHWLLWYTNMLAVRCTGRRYICVIHHGKDPSTPNVLKYTKFFKYASKVIAVSEDIKRNYDSVYGTNCIVIPPLIPFSFSELDKINCRKLYNVDADANIICQVGTIKEMKNPQTIIEALSLFNETELNRYNPHIVFAGKNNMMDSLQKLLNTYNLENRVHFLGLIPMESVKDVMRMSDLYLIASDYEGTSISLLEAMFNSMPILASDVKGITDMVIDRKSALLFPVKDAFALKTAIINFLDSIELRTLLGSNAKSDYDSRYDYSIVLDSYSRILGL